MRKILMLTMAMACSCVVTGCGGKQDAGTGSESREMGVESSASEQEEASEPTLASEQVLAPVLTVPQRLEEWASQYAFAYGQTYSLDLHRIGPADSFSLDISYEPLDGLALGYIIWDLDNDSSEELLLATCEDVLVELAVYEVEGEQVALAGSWKSATHRNEKYNYEYPVNMVLASSQASSDTPSEVSELFIYSRNGRTFIGYEHQAYWDLFADGVNATFLSFQYRDGALELCGDTIINGSSFDPEDVRDIDSSLARAGIRTNAEDWMYGQISLLKDAQYDQRVFGISTANKVSYSQGETWMQSNQKTLPLMDVYFLTRDELDAGKTASDIKGMPGSGAAAGESGSGSSVSEDERVDGQLFPDSSSRLLSEAEISDLSQQDLHFAVNEIYARHGYIFTKSPYKEYYPQYAWYRATTPAKEFDSKVLNDTEVENINQLKKYYK